MIEEVLFACDFSSSAQRALAYGKDLIERTGATLHVLHVRENARSVGEREPSLEGEALREQYRERCRDMMAPFAFGPDDAQVSCEMERTAATAPALIEYVKEHGVDLVLMGTQGRRGLPRLLFGSVAEEVLRTAPCPVLTARSSEDGEKPRGDVERVVVPVDFSEPSRNALQYAVRLASVYDVGVTLVHVLRLPKIPTVYELEFSGQSPEELEARVRTALKSWGDPLSVPRGCTYVVKQGEVVPTLLRVADAPSDLIVMATCGLTGVKRLMLGSVAERVLRRAPGAVVSARAFPGED